MGNMKLLRWHNPVGVRPCEEGESCTVGGYSVETEERLTRERLNAERIRVGCHTCEGWLDENLLCKKCGEQWHLATAKEIAMAEFWRQEVIRLQRVIREMKK